MNYREFPDINGPEEDDDLGEEALPFDYESDEDDYEIGEIEED
jgi:hypothetical protein